MGDLWPLRSPDLACFAFNLCRSAKHKGYKRYPHILKNYETRSRELSTISGESTTSSTIVLHAFHQDSNIFSI